MSHRSYDYLVRLNHSESEGILDGTVHVFSKLDGTNASVWRTEFGLGCGSRNRELTGRADNYGFLAWATSDDPVAVDLRRMVAVLPVGTVLYGEWLVRQTFKDYRDDAWRKFYIFDVLRPEGGYMPYDEWSPIAVCCNQPFVPRTTTLLNPTQELVENYTQQATFDAVRKLRVDELSMWKLKKLVDAKVKSYILPVV